MRVWDVAGRIPELISTVPHDSGGAGGRLRAVTAMEVRLVGLYTCPAVDHMQSFGTELFL